MAAGFAFFVRLKLWAIENMLVRSNVCCGCVVHARPGLHLECVCVCWCVCTTYVCVLPSRIPAVTLQSSDSCSEAAQLVSAAVSSEKIWRREFLLSVTKLVII